MESCFPRAPPGGFRSWPPRPPRSHQSRGLPAPVSQQSRQHNVSSTIFWHTGRMPADPFTLRQADQARTDFAIIEDELEAIHRRLSQLPTRREVWQAAMLGMLGGAVAAVTLIEAFAQACN